MFAKSGLGGLKPTDQSENPSIHTSLGHSNLAVMDWISLARLIDEMFKNDIVSRLLIGTVLQLSACIIETVETIFGCQENA